MPQKQAREERLQKTFLNQQVSYSNQREDSELEISFESDSSVNLNCPSPSDSEDSATEATSKANVSGKTKMIKISPDELLDCTAEIATRYKLGSRGHIAMLAAICEKGGIDSSTVPLSRSSVHQKRFHTLEKQGLVLNLETLKNLSQIV